MGGSVGGFRALYVYRKVFGYSLCIFKHYEHEEDLLLEHFSPLPGGGGRALQGCLTSSPSSK